MTEPQDESHFRPIGEQVKKDGLGTMEVESLCMECGKQGVTRLLPTYIPYFKEVIVMSFSCPHCGNRNSEVQSAGEIQPKGCQYTIHVSRKADLGRQVVKSEFCTITFPEVDLQIPAKRGQITTIEGLISDTVRDLEFNQPVRKHMQPEVYAKIEEVCAKLHSILGERKVADDEMDNNEDRTVGPLGARSEDTDSQTHFAPFTVLLDDPSGNSFVEYTGSIESSGAEDAKWMKRDYPRTKEQNIALGLTGQPSTVPAEAPVDADENMNQEELSEFENEEIYHFDGTCSSCNAPLQTLMKKVNIPYFKEVFIISTNCDNCGYRDNEVKSGAAISAKGRRLTLSVNDAEDLSRDILKSDTAGFRIPEIDLNLAPGTLGGRFTTLEGLLQNVYDELYEKVFLRGDSSDPETVRRFEVFLAKLKRAITAEACPYTVILDDPLANSYIQNPYAPDPDEQLKVENYERKWEQNEVLGINDMKVENYESNEDGQRKGELEDKPDVKKAKLEGEHE